MKTKLLIGTLLLILPVTGFSQTADDHVAQGRNFWAASDLVAANQSFSNAIVLAPNHPAANVLYAGTRVLVLPSQPAGSNFLNRLGVPAAGRDLFDWTAELPTDPAGEPLAPAGVGTAEFIALLRTNVLPALIAAEANLTKVTDPNFTLTLTSAETRSVAVTLDYGDIVLLRAILKATEYVVYTTHSWNLDVPLTALRNIFQSDEIPSLDQVLQNYPDLFTFATTNDLNAAKLAFQTGVTRYWEASHFIRNRATNVTRLFNLDASQSAAEDDFRLTLTDLTNSLATPVPLTLDSNYTIFLAAHFNAPPSPRSLLPQFQALGFGLGTLPDATFGGLVQGITGAAVDSLLSEELFPIPTIAPGGSIIGENFQFPVRVAKGHSYAVQVSTNLTTWSDVGAFLALSNTYSFTDPNPADLSPRYYRVVDRYTALAFGEEVRRSGAAQSEASFLISVPPGISYLQILISGGSGDCDLYVKYQTPPTLTSWDYRPYLHGNDEYTWIFAPAPGLWHVMLHGYKAYSRVSLVAYAY